VKLARSRAALNRLLVETDEIEQRRLREREAVAETEADPDLPA
jgi:hypothetical protein